MPVAPRLTDAQVAAAARAGGFSGSALPVAVAIALAESGGNASAYNGRGLDQSYGLWQINMKGALGPDRRKRYGLGSNTALYNPSTNARVAYAISGQGKNFKPWTTYTSQKYRLYLSRAKKATGQTGATLPASTTGGTGGSVTQIDFTPDSGVVQVDLDWKDFVDPWGMFQDDPPLGGEGGMLDGLGGGIFAPLGSMVKLMQWWTGALIKGAAWMANPDNWVRVAQVVAGGGLVLVGVNIMARPFLMKQAGQVADVLPMKKGASAVAAKVSSGKAAA